MIGPAPVPVERRSTCYGGILLSPPCARYLYGTGRSTMKFDRRYWILIAAAVLFSITASACTLYLASAGEHFMECNSVSNACFSGIGMVPCMALGTMMLIPVMVAIPYILRQNERFGLASVLVLGCIVAYTALDAANNVSAIMGFDGTYALSHCILTATNNVTGNIVGTGESLC